MTQLRCSRCKELKDEQADFYTRKGKRAGRVCKTCVLARKRELDQRDRELLRALRKIAREKQ